MSFAIGDFTFINLSRVFTRPTEQLAREVRPGVDGTTFWQTGKRAEPMQVASVVDVESVTAAQTLFAEYENQVGQILPVTWAGVLRTNTQAVILRVDPLDEGLHATVLGIGGTLGSSHAMLRALWTLEMVNVFPPVTP